MRLYRIDPADGPSPSANPPLVKANTQAQALRFMAETQYRASIPSGLEVAQLLDNGAQIFDATARPADPHDGDASVEEQESQAAGAIT